MKQISVKLTALFLIFTLILTMLAGCSKSAGGTEPAETAEETAAQKENDTLVVATGDFSQKFSAFFETTVYDKYISDEMTGVTLLASDREGNIVMNAIAGETIPYNGTDYTYRGLSDCAVIENEDGTVDYKITMRDDVVFSDGTPMTIDDVIFSMYVLCDPTYDGALTLFATPIEGLEEYRSGMETLFSLLLKAGRDNADFTHWDEAAQSAFWADLDQAGAAFAQEIVDACIASGAGANVADSAEAWGFDGAPENTAEFFTVMADAYDWDLAAMSDAESAGSSLFDLMEDYEAYAAGIAVGEGAPNISGIEKTGDYSMTVHMTEVDAAAIYQLTFVVQPLHYYGNAAEYDYENNKFGFAKGNLNPIKEKNAKPLGAGPYKFVSYENGTVTLEANENYMDGCPKIPYVLFKETSAADMLTGISTGTYDLTADASFNSSAVETIKGYNSNGELNGDAYTVSTVDNLGYGYIGMNANLVKVGEDGGSEQSRNLRKGLATLFAVYRDTVIDSYYGDLAAVIQYPISNTSWAAPRPADEGYQPAYSTDVDGNPIYTGDMTDEAKYEAALEAAVGYLKAAGYTWDGAAFTAAPEGASLSYEAVIPADGSGDHPAYGVLANAKEALATIGLTLEINDIKDGNILWDGLDAGTVEIWAAAWQATVDPDMYQVYYSENISENGGSNHYHIQDAALDELMMAARTSVDQSYRKATYQECLNTILDWGCEIPNYQRQNAVLVSTARVDVSTMTPDITTFWKWTADIQNLEMQ